MWNGAICLVKWFWWRVTKTHLLSRTYVVYMWLRERKRERYVTERERERERESEGDNTKKSITNIKTPKEKNLAWSGLFTCFCDSTLPDSKSFLGFVSVSKAQGWLLISYLFTSFCLQILTGSIGWFSLELCPVQELPTSQCTVFTSRGMVCAVSSINKVLCHTDHF